jgi:hypothetical protein
MQTKRKKRIVEIYFILYLAALVFLLPTSRDKIEDKSRGGISIQYPFSLQPDKTTLNCRLVNDSTGLKIISFDSVNTIFFSGDVEDISFDFIVENLSLKQTLTLNSDSLTKTNFFRIEEHLDKKAVDFFWQPPLNDRVNKTYLVEVIASAKPKAIVGNNPNELSKPIIKVKTQFSLNVIFIDAGIGNTFARFEDLTKQRIDSLQRTFSDVTSILLKPPPSFSLIVPYKDIKMIATTNWSNTIYAQNINFLKDLVSKPEVNVITEPKENGGLVYNYELKEYEIILHGRTPSYGTMKVEVKVVRFDGKHEKQEFIVKPQLIEEPEFDRVMYPEETYTIDPKLPFLTMGKEVKAYLRDNGVNRAVSQQGEKFKFTPTLADIGKEFTLERYIDDNLFGQIQKIRVLDYPDPEIVDIQQRSKKEVLIITRAYGLYNGKRNEVKNFIIEGNCTYQDQRGDLKDFDKPIVRLQYFLVTPKRQDQPFKFKVIAVDSRGKRSFEKVYQEQ